MKSTKTVLVTGADGFIGSHLCEALVQNGYGVRAFTYYNSLGARGWLDHIDPKLAAAIEYLDGDIRDAAFVRHAVKGVDAVLHLAALIAIPYSYKAAESYIETNIYGTLNVLQAGRDEGVQKIVCTSTSEVYGTAQYIPIDEKHPLNAQSPYAASKTGADQLALSFQKSFDLPIAIARPFNAFGPRQSMRAVIPAIITQLLTKKGMIKLGALEPTRDFTFVEDTASGLIAVMESDKSIGEVINLGSKFEISIGDLARMAAKIAGQKDIEILQDNQRLRPKNSEVERLFACTKKADSLLNWKTNYSGQVGFEKGLEKTINWFSDPANKVFYRREDYVV